MDNKYVIGIDFGSDSVRAVIINAKNGEEVSSSVCNYPRWKLGLYCNPAKNQYRQHPLDYIESLTNVVNDALSNCDSSVADAVCAISFDTTCSTPVIVDRNGNALSLLAQHAENPNAMFVLWKDHTAIEQADQINTLSRSWPTDYTRYQGGVYSCEWVWAKVLHCLREDATIRSQAYSWVEHCDWIGALLTDNTTPEKILRSRSAAGHKAMWHAEWAGLPSDEFLTALDPLLSGMRDHLYSETYTADTCVGGLCGQWAEKLGLKKGIAVGLGSIDCHVGAVGAQIEPNILVKTVGTSTCDIIITDYASMRVGADGARNERIVKGICGQVDGGVVNGYIGLEAGQSAFGDIYAWFKELMCWPLKNMLADDACGLTREQITRFESKMIECLSAQAQAIDIADSIPLALDWFNGRRTPDANARVQGAISGLTLATSAPAMFRALVESTAFGSRAICERLLDQGVRIDAVIALGGIANKSPFVMQTLSDVMGITIKIAKSEQACAFGAAMFASVVSGVHPTIFDAQKHMGQGFCAEYHPDPVRHEYYTAKYVQYKELGNYIDKR